MCIYHINQSAVLFLVAVCLLVVRPTYGQVTDVKAVVIIFRHGDRTPVEPYPNDPYRNESFWPVGFGQLTNEGKKRHYDLGQWFRQRYTQLIPQLYSEKDIQVHSTDVDRTLMSAQANLAGLYAPLAKQTFEPGLKWQPIPVHTAPETLDPILAMKKPCAKYDDLYDQLMHSDTFVNVQHLNHDLYAYLSRQSGSNVTSLETLEYLYNTLNIEKAFNYSIPLWADRVLPKMERWAFMSFQTQCYNLELSRLKTGLLWNKIVDYFKQKQAETEPKTSSSTNAPYALDFKAQSHKNSPKVLVFSAHDTTIANMLNSVNLFEPHAPPYAATILLELTNNNLVRFYYKNTTEPVLLQLPQCPSTSCHLTDFAQALSKLTLTQSQWDSECKDVPFLKHLGWLYYAACALFVFLAILLCTLAVCLCHLMGRQRAKQMPYVRLPDEDGYA